MSSEWKDRMAALALASRQRDDERRRQQKALDAHWEPIMEERREALGQAEPDHDGPMTWDDLYWHLHLHHDWSTVWLGGKTAEELEGMHHRAHVAPVTEEALG